MTKRRKVGFIVLVKGKDAFVVVKLFVTQIIKESVQVTQIVSANVTLLLLQESTVKVTW